MTICGCESDGKLPEKANMLQEMVGHAWCWNVLGRFVETVAQELGVGRSAEMEAHDLDFLEFWFGGQV